MYSLYEDEPLWVLYIQMNLARLGPLQIFVRWIVNRWLFTIWISQLLCLSLISVSYSGARTISLWRQNYEIRVRNLPSGPVYLIEYFGPMVWQRETLYFVNADENNLLRLCHCSLTELKGSNIHMSCKKTANVIVNVKYKIRTLRNSSSIQLPHWFF